MNKLTPDYIVSQLFTYNITPKRKELLKEYLDCRQEDSTNVQLIKLVYIYVWAFDIEQMYSKSIDNRLNNIYNIVIDFYPGDKYGVGASQGIKRRKAFFTILKGLVEYE